MTLLALVLVVLVALAGGHRYWHTMAGAGVVDRAVRAGPPGTAPAGLEVTSVTGCGLWDSLW